MSATILSMLQGCLDKVIDKVEDNKGILIGVGVAILVLEVRFNVMSCRNRGFRLYHYWCLQGGFFLKAEKLRHLSPPSVEARNFHCVSDKLKINK